MLERDFDCARNGPLAFFYAFVLNKKHIYDLVAEVCVKDPWHFDEQKDRLLQQLSLKRSIGGWTFY